MFPRSILSELRKWAQKEERKPLILRGARQVGKTTVVNQFAEEFDEYLSLNLEKPEDSQLFTSYTDIPNLIRSIFFIKNKKYDPQKRTLIFIDEIQQVPEALNILRYFYEETPQLYIISAGSMLETIFNEKLSFPVGRVEYMVVRPASFPEFLGAIGETAALEEIKNIPVRNYASKKLFDLFHTYALIGGMPEAVAVYAKTRDLISLKSIYESLIISYMDDVEKYARNAKQTDIIRHTIRSAFSSAGKRITFEGFGNSSYGSREIGEALRALEKAFFLTLIYPNTEATLPLLPSLRKKPRLQLLDSGMINYFTGIQKEILGTADLQKIHEGMLIEHIIGQELLATQYSALNTLNFWTNEKKSSQAEIDFLWQHSSKLVPVEVKSGAAGKLKSLHQFMDLAPHNIAIRFYSGEFADTMVSTPGSGKSFRLLNLPYYLGSQIDGYVEWMLRD